MEGKFSNMRNKDGVAKLDGKEIPKIWVFMISLLLLLLLLLLRKL